MTASLTRRHLLKAALGCGAVLALPTAWAADPFARHMQQLEASAGITLGLWALDTGSGKQLAWRSEERFAFCSTFKAVLAGAILHKSQAEPGLLERQIRYEAGQLVSYSPVTEKHVGAGLSVAELCAAAVQYSDNTAANLLLERVEGPPGLTAFARSLGDPTFRLDRNEPALNTALPGDPRDTTSPLAMGMTLQRLVLTDGLPAVEQRQLQTWLKGNTTGDSRIRAGVPAGWTVGDKTGSGDYGVANDVAVIWPSGRAPWVLVIFTRGAQPKAAWNSEVIAQATRGVVEQWAG